MKLYLHCGFPKTGTTALQKWLSNNEKLLEEHNLYYPSEFRDHEGIAHHCLNGLLSNSIDKAAREIFTTCSLHDSGCTLLSTEGLCNLLGSDDVAKQGGLLKLLSILIEMGIDPVAIFTLRPVDAYVRSIAVQNILYDRLTAKPSDFAAYTIDTLARAYRNLSDLAATHNIAFFDHSLMVNHEICNFMLGESDDISFKQKGQSVSIDHSSPPDLIILLFMWINASGVFLPADLHSYLRFGKSTLPTLEENLGGLLSDQGKEEYLNGWEPSSTLMHSVLSYHNMAWEKHLSFKVNTQKHQASSSAKSSIRKRIIGDLPLLLSTKLAHLDYLYRLVHVDVNPGRLQATFKALVQKGSEEYGQDFESLLRASA